MYKTTNELIINKNHFLYNLNHGYELCKKQNINLTFVTKSLCADPILIELIDSSPINRIADSRIANFAKMNSSKEKFLIRPCSPSEAFDVVENSDLSIQTELDTIIALESAAKELTLTHNIILLVDLGDLRDGIMYTDKELLLRIAKYICNSEFLNLTGIAANFNCFANLQPTYENMSVLNKLNDLIKDYYNTDTPTISGGNSSSILYFVNNELKMPDYITELRMGEVILLGRNPSSNTFVEGFKYDVFTLESTLIEVKTKTFVEDGTTYTMKRGVIALGQQDLQISHLLPIDDNIKIIGACSDECVLDLGNTNYKVGDKIAFNLEYGALMSAFASHFIARLYV